MWFFWNENEFILTIFFCSEEVATSRHYNGKGIATYPNGDTYDGYFVAGVSIFQIIIITSLLPFQLRDGPNGVYTYNTHKNAEEVADTYKGAWKENKKHGIGK